MMKTIITASAPFLIFVISCALAQIPQPAPTAQQIADRAQALSVSCDGSRNALIAHAGSLADEVAQLRATLAATQAELEKLKPKDKKPDDKE